ncbi:uncharacterized protein LOC122433161 [Cervus canadensis]|uniref:uncharacterized protein LOC122433161 n=1 Tax=Cervus canadensis TaxID=1574408 RepID=UPI001CA31832|nr:uncharacterized protein LOC122433161 [Cervus canadensis]
MQEGPAKAIQALIDYGPSSLGNWPTLSKWQSQLRKDGWTRVGDRRSCGAEAAAGVVRQLQAPRVKRPAPGSIMQTNEHKEVKAPTCLFLLRTVPSVGRRSTRLHHSGLPAAPVSEPGPWVSGPGIASPSAFSHSFGPSFGPPPSSRTNPAPPLAIPVFFQEGSCSDCAMLPPLSGFWLLPQAPLCLTWPRRRGSAPVRDEKGWRRLEGWARPAARRKHASSFPKCDFYK